MAAVMIEKFEALVDPRIEAGLNVTRDFANHVFAILEPLELGAGRRRPDRFLTFLALISKTHRSRMYRGKRKGPRAKREPFPGFAIER